MEGPLFKAPPGAPFPDFRVTISKPFANVRVDFAGQLFVKSEEGKMKKTHIALFTCIPTRAIHLKLVQGLNTFTFMNCFRKFCARRGTPRLVNSDNEKTFKAAARLLIKLSKDEHSIVSKRFGNSIYHAFPGGVGIVSGWVCEAFSEKDTWNS